MNSGVLVVVLVGFCSANPFYYINGLMLQGQLVKFDSTVCCICTGFVPSYMK